MLERVDRRHPDREQDRHRGQQHPSLPSVSGELPDHVREAGGNQQDREDLQEARERRRVLERVRRVGVEEAAAVGAELLDRLLGGNRALSDRLRPPSTVLTCVGALKLSITPCETNTTLRMSDSGSKHVEARPRQVDPEVADLPVPGAREPAHERHGHRHPDARRDEVLPREADHLREVAHAALTRVRLPVGVGDEGDGGVEREQTRHARHAGGFSGRYALQPQKREQHEDAHAREHEHGERVRDPRHLAGRVDTHHAVDGALDRRQAPDAGRCARPSTAGRGTCRPAWRRATTSAISSTI